MAKVKKKMVCAIPYGDIGYQSYGVNHEHLKLYIHPSMNYHFSGFDKPHNQRVITGFLLVQAALYCDDRAKQFVIDNVTATA